MVRTDATARGEARNRPVRQIRLHPSGLHRSGGVSLSWLSFPFSLKSPIPPQKKASPIFTVAHSKRGSTAVETFGSGGERSSARPGDRN